MHCATRCEEYSAHHDGKSTHCQVLPCSHWPWRRHQPLQHTGRAPYASISDCLRCEIYLGSKQPLPLQALHNTHLLASYAAIDRRVKILCYVMKVFAKVSMIFSSLNQRSCHSSTGILFPLYCTFHAFWPFLTFLLQMCDIGDASRGSLSSYAYTLMVLFFLQQRNPPVIPVLQEVQITSVLHSVNANHIHWMNPL